MLCIDTPFNEIGACYISQFDDYRSSDIGFFYSTLVVSDILAKRSDLTLKSTFLMDQSADSIVVFVDYSRYNRIDASKFSII